jgi:hypothetical protein
MSFVEPPGRVSRTGDQRQPRKTSPLGLSLGPIQHSSTEAKTTLVGIHVEFIDLQSIERNSNLDTPSSREPRRKTHHTEAQRSNDSEALFKVGLGGIESDTAFDESPYHAVAFEYVHRSPWIKDPARRCQRVPKTTRRADRTRKSNELGRR